MIKKLCLSTILVLSLLFNVNAQITAFDFNGITTAVTTANATTTIANTSMSVISRGSGVTATSLGNAFAGSAWDATTAATAITGNDYFEFTLSANSTYKLSLSALEATFRRSGSGPTSFQWRYSINGGSSFVDIGSSISYSLSNTNGDAQTSIDLSVITALQNVANPTTIIFRLYGWGGAAGGTFALGRLTGNDLAIGGTVSTTLPLITLGNQTQMVSCLGVPVNKTVTVSGTNLTGSAIVFGPMPNYGFSKVPGGPYYTKDSVTYSGTTLATTNMYIQYTSTTTGTDTVNIPVGGGGDTALLSSPRLTNILPNVIISSMPVSAAVCPGANVTLAGTGATSYTWSGGITNNVAFVPSATQTYTVTGSDGTCSNTASIQVVVNTLPTISASAMPLVICNGQSAVVNGSGGTSYSWNNSVTNNVAFFPISTQTYMVTGTDANGCTNTSTISVAVNSLPTVTANATQSTICDGKPTTLSGGGASTYSWNGGAVNNTSFFPNATQTYTVTGTDANFCSNTSSIQIIVNSLPSVTANATTTFLCEGTPTTLSGSGTATSYSWNNGATNNVAFNPTTSTTYMVTGSDANSCTNTSTIDVTVNLKPNITIGTNANTISPKCQGLSFSLVGNFSWNTYGNGATSVIFSGGAPITFGVDFDADGVNDTFGSNFDAALNTYTVTATDIAGCTQTASITISGIINPAITASVNPASICANQSATVTGGGGVSYIWDNGVTNNTPFVGTATTTYQVIGTDGNGCTATSTVQLVVNNISTNLVTSSSSNTINQTDGTTVNYTSPSCEMIATINDGASGNVLGSVTSSVTITPSVGIYNGQPYVRRWYEITPTNNGAATVTLYLTQADLDDYNANNGAFADLPTSGNNADPNIANIRITKVDGTLGTGTPLVITPSMNWNGSYWEAMFSVTGFSQFYFHSVNPLNAALPVTIAGFNAIKQENKDIVSWKTLNEFNNHYFNVLYSSNGVDYKTIDKIESKATNGNSQLVIDYSIENNSTQLGHNYYKLEQVDLDGKINIHSQVLDVVRNQDGSVVSIYPNPATDIINIKMYHANATKTTIQLIDMSGRKLKEIATTNAIGNNSVSMDIQDVSKGLYMIQILENGKITSSTKVRK